MPVFMYKDEPPSCWEATMPYSLKIPGPPEFHSARYGKPSGRLKKTHTHIHNGTTQVQLPGHRSDQIWTTVAESHSQVPEGCVWSWPRGPISCAGWGPSSSLVLSVFSYLRLSLFTASGALAAWCAPQPPPWSQLHNHQLLSPCICLLACLWRKRDSAGLHSAQIPPSVDTVNIQTHQRLHRHAVIKLLSIHPQT